MKWRHRGSGYRCRDTPDLPRYFAFGSIRSAWHAYSIRRAPFTAMFDTILQQPAYQFLTTHPQLGPNLLLLGLSGSIAYGTDNEKSDLDLRGITLNPKSDLVGLTKFEQYIDRDTDTVIYGFNKCIRLLMENNPSVLELLGLNREHYLVLHPIGQALIQNTSLFLSKRILHTFGDYADAQLRRIQNALARDTYPQAEKETHILNSVRHAIHHFNERYRHFESGSLCVYLDNAVNPEFEKEIFLDTTLCHYPLRDYKNILKDMESIIRGYDKLGNRNKKKDDYHLNKHAMHLVRLYLQGIDILKNHRIRTWDEEHIPLFLDIKNGKYRTADGMFNEAFFQCVNTLKEEMAQAAKTCTLPEEPKFDAIHAFVISINEKVIKNEIP